MSCLSSRHGTIEAGHRKDRAGHKCTCPDVLKMVAAHRTRENEARRVRRARTQKPLDRSQDKRFSRVSRERFESAVPMSTAWPADVSSVEACRIVSLGGQLPDIQAEDFLRDSSRGDSATERAVSICQRCPLRRPCLLAAVQRREPHGVWGGLTAYQRRRPVLVAQTLLELKEGTS